MSKEKSVEILKGYGFTIATETTNSEVVLVSLGQHDGEVPIVEVILYPNSAGEYLLNIDDCFLCPIVGYERELIKYLNQFHVGWDHLVN
jgi:hypothetical protein